ncbi:MAG: LEA type 2 family protein, partial [Methyloprofundus sp.]|nr:LEA type 2 family protein [Methyloprofundus sp.]
MTTRVQIITFFIVIFIGVVIVLLRNIVEIKNLEAPHVEIVDVDFLKFGLDNIELVAVLNVNNKKNTRELHLSEISYSLEINGNLLVDQLIVDDFVLERRPDNEIRLPVKLSTPAVADLLSDLSSKNRADYKFDASVTVEIPSAGRVRLPVTFIGVFPVPHSPKIHNTSFSIKEISWLHIDFIFNAEVFNPNVFSIALDAINYSVTIQQVEIMRSSLPESVVLNPEQSSLLIFPVRFDFREAGRSVMSALRQLKPMSYQVSAQAIVTSDW